MCGENIIGIELMLLPCCKGQKAGVHSGVVLVIINVDD